MISVPTPLEHALTARVRDTVQSRPVHGYTQFTFRTMSTTARVCFHHDHPGTAIEFQNAVVRWIARFEARYSRYLPESLISQVNARAGGGWTEIDREFDGLLDLCDEMHRLTGGIFDPASLPSLALWSWNTPRDELPSAQAIDAARTLWDWKTVQRCPGAVCLPEHGMGMDLGGIGKEFAVDQVMEIARQHDIHNILVDIGQDVRAQGRGPGKDAWYVGLEEPVDPDGPPPTRGCWACLRITGVAVASSGDYHRCFTRNGRRYGHILDPRTGEPVHNGCQSVNVIAPTCMLAGILSTTALILGPECGLELLRRHSSPSGVEGCITTPTARCQTRRFSDHVPF